MSAKYTSCTYDLVLQAILNQVQEVLLYDSILYLGTGMDRMCPHWSPDEFFHCTLYPGETITSPSICLQNKATAEASKIGFRTEWYI